MSRYILYLLFLFFGLQAYAQQDNNAYVLVLGVAQDGGYPHAGCSKACCRQAWTNPSLSRYVVSLALVDPTTRKWWLFEATPDLKEQLQYFRTLTGEAYNYLPDGIFITHAHIGHYTGLMQLGREVMNTKDVPVYVLPRMKDYLEHNGPWSQLVTLHNIKLVSLQPQLPTSLTPSISVSAFTVPHRDEYSETAGFKIITSSKRYLFIPDIDKWQKWQRPITDEVKSVDVALLDATFLDADELPGRKMSEVPHPLVMETLTLFENEDAVTKSKIDFIHFNHTNPLLWDRQRQDVIKKKGFKIAQQGEKL